MFLNALEGKRNICLCKDFHVEKTTHVGAAPGGWDASQLNKFYYLYVTSLAQSQDTQQEGRAAGLG
jgi:hypothetical protein